MYFPFVVTICMKWSLISLDIMPLYSMWTGAGNLLSKQQHIGDKQEVHCLACHIVSRHSKAKPNKVALESTSMSQLSSLGNCCIASVPAHFDKSLLLHHWERRLWNVLLACFFTMVFPSFWKKEATVCLLHDATACPVVTKGAMVFDPLAPHNFVVCSKPVNATPHLMHTSWHAFTCNMHQHAVNWHINFWCNEPELDNMHRLTRVSGLPCNTPTAV